MFEMVAVSQMLKVDAGTGGVTCAQKSSLLSSISLRSLWSEEASLAWTLAWAHWLFSHWRRRQQQQRVSRRPNDGEVLTRREVKSVKL